MNTRKHGAPLQDVIYVLHHNALHVLQLGGQCGHVAARSAPIRKGLARPLNVRVELYEGVRTGHGVHLQPPKRTLLLKHAH